MSYAAGQRVTWFSSVKVLGEADLNVIANVFVQTVSQALQGCWPMAAGPQAIGWPAQN